MYVPIVFVFYLSLEFTLFRITACWLYSSIKLVVCVSFFYLCYCNCHHVFFYNINTYDLLTSHGTF